MILSAFLVILNFLPNNYCGLLDLCAAQGSMSASAAQGSMAASEAQEAQESLARMAPLPT